MLKTALIIVFTLFLSVGFSQELNCNVRIIRGQNAQTAQVDEAVFTELETSIRDFMNNKRWTTDMYKVEERIDCEIQVTVNQVEGQDRFQAEIQVTSSRPVYNGNMPTTLFNFNDPDFNFRYVRNARLDWSIDQHRDNLTSVLAFYAYMVLAYDYDSFSLEGGTHYFTKAQQIVTNASNAPEAGWKSNESISNRYWLVENALHSAFKPLRKCFFEYHRLGMDTFYEANMAESRKVISKCLNYLQQVYNSRPGAVNVQAFYRAKSEELIEIFKKATPQEKTRAIEILKKTDPLNSSKYDGINKG